jgi:hypothetical protein
LLFLALRFRSLLCALRLEFGVAFGLAFEALCFLLLFEL